MIICLLAVTNCGGGGGSGGSGSTPSPNPLPTPTPTPTPTGTRFTASGIGSLAAIVYIDNNGNGSFNDAVDGRVQTSLSGEFGRGVPGSLNPAAGQPPAAPNVRMMVSGFDVATGVGVGVTAPLGATVFSPLTTLIDYAGSQEIVRQGLGLNSGPAPLRATTDLLHFDAAQQLGNADPAIAQDAARIASANFKVVALATLLTPFQGDPIDWSGASPEAIRYIAEVIKETGSGNLEDKTVILAILKKSPHIHPPAENMDTIAGLITQYMAFTPPLISNHETAFRYSIAFRFYIMAEVRRLFSSVSATDLQRARNINHATILDAFEKLTNTSRPIVEPRYFAVPDYREMYTSNIMTLSKCSEFPEVGDIVRPGEIYRWLPSCNDVSFAGFFGSARDTYRTISVSTDTSNSLKISVRLNDKGRVEIDPVDGFVGYAFFDYVGRNGSEESSSRVHVRILPDP